MDELVPGVIRAIKNEFYITVPRESVFITPMTSELKGDHRFMGVLSSDDGEYITIKCAGMVDDLTKSVFKRDELNKYRDMRE